MNNTIKEPFYHKEISDDTYQIIDEKLRLARLGNYYDNDSIYSCFLKLTSNKYNSLEYIERKKSIEELKNDIATYVNKKYDNLCNGIYIYLFEKNIIYNNIYSEKVGFSKQEIIFNILLDKKLEYLYFYILSEIFDCILNIYSYDKGKLVQTEQFDMTNKKNNVNKKIFNLLNINYQFEIIQNY